MHTVELLEHALSIAETLGYRVRQEWLGGAGGGACEFAGRRWIFVDLSLNATEQLDQVRGALMADPAVYTLDLSPAMRKLLDIRRAA
jgi:hypothetical protein